MNKIVKEGSDMVGEGLSKDIVDHIAKCDNAMRPKLLTLFGLGFPGIKIRKVVPRLVGRPA